MKDDLRNVNTLVTVSGGMECAAALLWSLKKGLKPVGVHLFNKNKDFAMKKILESLLNDS